MTIVGLALIIEDKKRWMSHTKRSADMMNLKAKASLDMAENELDIEEENEGKKKRNGDKEYEYEGRITDRTLFIIAFFLGGFGELLGMLFVKHKWYRKSYKVGMPIIAFVNIIFVIFIAFIFSEFGKDGGIKVT